MEPITKDDSNTEATTPAVVASLDDWVIEDAPSPVEKEEKVSAPEPVAVSLDEWQITPATLDDWVVADVEDDLEHMPTEMMVVLDQEDLKSSKELEEPEEPISEKVLESEETLEFTVDDQLLEVSEDDSLGLDLESETLEIESADLDLEPEETADESVELDLESESVDDSAELEIELEPEPVDEPAELDLEPERADEPVELDLEPELADEATELDLEPEPELTDEPIELDLEPEPAEEPAELEIELEPELTDEPIELDLEPEPADETAELDLEPEPADEQVELDSEPELAEESAELDLGLESVDLELEPVELDSEPELASEPAELDLEPEPIGEPAEPAAELEITPSTSPILLESEDLAESHEKLAPLELSLSDLAERHVPGVLRLSEENLRETSTLAVLRLSTHDLAENHRVVIELDPNFFEDHGIECDEYGVVLLSAEDLVDPSCLAPAALPRIRKARVRKEGSSFTDEKLIRWSLYVILGVMVLLPIRFHFRYSWTTISEQKYESFKEKSATIDWLWKDMYMHRTPESGISRYYGRQLLNTSAYEKAQEKYGFVTMLLFENSESRHRGDDFE